MIAEVMRWCDEQLTIDHNLVPTTPGRRAPLAHLHPDWFTALLLCGKNSLAITKLSSRPYFIKYAFLHFLFTKLKSNVKTPRRSRMFQNQLKSLILHLCERSTKISIRTQFEREDSSICQISVQTEGKQVFSAKIQISHFLEILFVLAWLIKK